MKRLLWVLPLALLLLCGCAEEAIPTEPEPSPGLYEPGNVIEGISDAAVKAYPLGEYDYRALAKLGKDYLLFGEDSLTLLSGENLTPVITIAAPGLPLPGSGQIQLSDTGLCYYSETEKSVIFLGSTLLEVGRLHLTEEITGTACLSPQWNKLYYCVPGSIHELDLATGMTKTLKTLTTSGNSITGILESGKYLRCTTMTQAGTYVYSLISTETGQTLYEGEKYGTIVSGSKGYCHSAVMGAVREFVFAQGEEKPGSIFFPVEETVLPLPANYALLHLQNGEKNVTVDYYDLTTGLRSAQLVLPAKWSLDNLCGDGEYVWFSHEDVLYRWNPRQSATGDETVYTDLHYSREEQDETGLGALEERIAKLEQAWGVDVLWREEVLEVIPWESYRFETEFVPQVYAAGLDRLEQAFSQFPQDFFIQAAQWTGSPLQLVLVRGIYGEPEQGTLQSASSIQYQLENKVYLAISLWEDVPRAFYHGVSHLAETRILSTCTAYYEWNTLNPPGFLYDNNYITNQNRQDEQYLQEADRSFIDMYAMSFAMEDRARIFEYACLPGNEGYFTSATMQEKLRRVCSGIRQAFGLTEESYLWEQYIQK